MWWITPPVVFYASKHPMAATEREDRVVLLLAPLVEPPPGAVPDIGSAFRDMLGSGIETEVAVVPEIKPGPGGKYRLIVPLRAQPDA